MLFRDRRVTVRIYVPADYEWSAREYPVVYMFDGHNLFDRHDLDLRQGNGASTRRCRGLGEPAIVVGIDAPQNRYDRYAPCTPSVTGSTARAFERPPAQSGSAATATRLRRSHRTSEAVRRSHLPGCERSGAGRRGRLVDGRVHVFLVVGTRYQDRVSRVLAFSPVALDEPMRGFELREAIVGAGAPVAQRYYLDMGDRERLDYVRNPQELVDNLEGLRSALVHAGHRDVLARIVPGGVMTSGHGPPVSGGVSVGLLRRRTGLIPAASCGIGLARVVHWTGAVARVVSVVPGS